MTQDWLNLLENTEELYPLALKAIGLSNERIADRLGVSCRAVEYWTAGTKAPRRSSWRMAAIAARKELAQRKELKDPDQFQFYLGKLYL